MLRLFHISQNRLWFIECSISCKLLVRWCCLVFALIVYSYCFSFEQYSVLLSVLYESLCFRFYNCLSCFLCFEVWVKPFFIFWYFSYCFLPFFFNSLIYAAFLNMWLISFVDIINTIFSCFKFLFINIVNRLFSSSEFRAWIIFFFWGPFVSLIQLAGFQLVLFWCVVCFNINVSLVMVRKRSWLYDSECTEWGRVHVSDGIVNYTSSRPEQPVNLPKESPLILPLSMYRPEARQSCANSLLFLFGQDCFLVGVFLWDS